MSAAYHMFIFPFDLELEIKWSGKGKEKWVWIEWFDIFRFFIQIDLSDMGCMSPLYATPPISPGSDNGPNFEDPFETPSAIFSAHNMENNDHFARDTHMRIILGNAKDSQPSK